MITQALGADVGFQPCGAIRQPTTGWLHVFTGAYLTGDCFKIDVWFGPNHYREIADLGSLKGQIHSAYANVTNFVDFFSNVNWNYVYCCTIGGQPIYYQVGYHDTIAPWKPADRQHIINVFTGNDGCTGSGCPPWTPSSIEANSP